MPIERRTATSFVLSMPQAAIMLPAVSEGKITRSRRILLADTFPARPVRNPSVRGTTGSEPEP